MNEIDMYKIFAVLAGVYFGYKSIKNYKKNKENQEDMRRKIFGYIGYFIFLVLFNLILFALMTETLKYLTNDRKTKEKKEKVVSIKDGDKIGGNFILGSGVINDKRVYIMIKEISKDTYKEITIPINETIIKEDVKDKDFGYLGYEVCDNKNNTYFDLRRLKRKNGCLIIRDEIRKKEYILHIPKGTIIRELKVN